MLLCFRLYLISTYSTPVSNAAERNLQNRTLTTIVLRLLYLWGSQVLLVLEELQLLNLKAMKGD